VTRIKNVKNVFFYIYGVRGSSSFCGALSQLGLNPIKLAYGAADIGGRPDQASGFNRLDQYASQQSW